MTTKTTKAYVIPSDLRSSDPTVAMPVEIHHSDGIWFAVYLEAEDVEYPDLYELARAHSIDVTYDTLEEWRSYTYQRRADTITMKQAVEAFNLANSRGEGYAPYTDDVTDDSIEQAVAAAERDGWVEVLARETSQDVVLLRNGDGEYMAIGGDAMGRNAWATPITVE
jgi:hypothetical protein